jgi:hypothetical protein
LLLVISARSKNPQKNALVAGQHRNQLTLALESHQGTGYQLALTAFLLNRQPEVGPRSVLCGGGSWAPTWPSALVGHAVGPRLMSGCGPFWCLRGIPAARHYPRDTGDGAPAVRGADAVTCERVSRHKLLARAELPDFSSLPSPTAKHTRLLQTADLHVVDEWPGAPPEAREERVTQREGPEATRRWSPAPSAGSCREAGGY